MNVKQLRERFEKSAMINTLPTQQPSKKKVQKRQDISPQLFTLQTKQENNQTNPRPVNLKIQQDNVRKTAINPNFLDELSRKLNKNQSNSLAQQASKNQLPTHLAISEISNIKHYPDQTAIKQQKSELPVVKTPQAFKKQKIMQQKPEKQIKMEQAGEINFDDILSNASTQNSREYSAITRYGIDEHHPKGSDNQIFSKLIEQQNQSTTLESESQINQSPRKKRTEKKKQQSSIISRVGQHIFKRSETITQDQKMSAKTQKNNRINYVIDLIFGESDIENIPKKQYQTFEESKKLNQMLQTIDQILVTKIQDKEPMQIVQNINEGQVQIQRQKSALLLPNQVLTEMIAKFQNNKQKIQQSNRLAHQRFNAEPSKAQKPMEKERSVTPKGKKAKKKLQNFDDI